MKLDWKKLTLRAILCLCVAYLLTFAVYYVDSYLYERTLEPIRYIAELVNKLTYFLLPSIAALLALMIRELCGTRSAAISLIGMTLPRLIYFIPIFYLILLPEGFDSLEALGYGSLFALGEAVIAYLISVLIALIIYTVARCKGKDKNISKWFHSTDAFDLSNALSFALITFSVLPFIYYTVVDIISTVSFLNSVNNYKANEIIMIVVFFLFDILVLFAYYFILFRIKAYALRKFGEEKQ